MQEKIAVNGIVIKSEPVGEYDRRVVILTLERGKITAFARGARKPNSRFVAGTNPFVFGEFYLYEGKNSYSLNDVVAKNYFDELRQDFVAAYYGMYFLEVADYYTRENNDEKEMLKLLYQSLRALGKENLNNQLIKAVYEIKSIVVNGEFARLLDDEYMSATKYAVDYIEKSSIEKLYTFALKDEVLTELTDYAKRVCKRNMRHEFKSLEILDTLISD